ncbi:protein Lto1p [Monosporozyma unispora]|nr:hypothetical protein C6P44_000119 [Kazachstania unispora]
MDFEENLLKLEEHFYQEGFEEGQNENLHNNFMEGKQFGLQVGFQRYVLLGQIVGLCDILDSLDLQNIMLTKNIASVRKLIDGIEMNNDEKNVEQLEKTLVKLKNKFRTILLSFQRLTKDRKLKKHLNFDDVDDLSRMIGGKMQTFVEDEDVSEAKTTQDQMHEW